MAKLKTKIIVLAELSNDDIAGKTDIVARAVDVGAPGMMMILWGHRRTDLANHSAVFIKGTRKVAF